MSTPKRSIELDFLRTVAVVLVLFRHLNPLPEDTPPFVQALLAPWIEAGWIGVDLFFVLSGFLISGLLFREYLQYGRIDYKTFLIRRGLKIYPSFYLLILATVVAGVAQGWHVPWVKIIREVFFFQNYRTGLWSHTWSLAVEEHFYLLLPLLLIMLARRAPGKANSFQHLPPLFLALAVTLLAIRLLTAWRAAFTSPDLDTLCHVHLFPTHLRIDSLFFGVLLSYLHHFHHAGLREWVMRHQLLLVGIAFATITPCLFLPLEKTPFLYTGGFSLVYLGMGAMLLLCLTRGLPTHGRIGFFYRWCAFLGAHSYSIYLWHLAVAMLIQMILINRFHLPWWILVSAFFAGSFVTGVVLGKLIEIPALHLRDRLFPSRSKPLEVLKVSAS